MNDFQNATDIFVQQQKEAIKKLNLRGDLNFIAHKIGLAKIYVKDEWARKQLDEALAEVEQVRDSIE